jgi:glutathione S-transferase
LRESFSQAVEKRSIAGAADASDNAPMYTLHIGNKNYSTWSLRPWALLSELGIPLEEVNHVFGADFARTIEGKSPTRRVPALHDGKRIVWDSLAIVEYVAERHEGVWPKDPDARAWARCAAAEMHSGFQTLRNMCSMSCGVRVKLHSQPEALKNDIARLAELWAEGLRRFGGPFLAGPKFTAVDAFFCPVAYRVLGYDLQLPAEAAAYAKRLLELPSMKRWYDAALAETTRDHAHDAEVEAFGTITQDLRKGAKASTPA